VALLLRKRGIAQVRPLLGGLDGWLRLSYPLEEIAEVPVQKSEPASTVSAPAQ
jgi:3-mercaptopyruvate sulfurtransferase SseA